MLPELTFTTIFGMALLMKRFVFMFGLLLGSGCATASPKVTQSAPFSAAPGTAVVRGALDKDAIRHVIRTHIGDVKRCYEQTAANDPKLQGRVVVKFTIATTGDVTSSSIERSTTKNDAVDGCVAQATKTWKFPQPKRGIVVVSYPFELTMPGAAGESENPAPGSVEQ
jgi:TonB family protein